MTGATSSQTAAQSSIDIPFSPEQALGGISWTTSQCTQAALRHSSRRWPKPDATNVLCFAARPHPLRHGQSPGCSNVQDRNRNGSFLHSWQFSAFRSMIFHSRPVHSLTLSSHRFLCLPLCLPPWTVPCRTVLASPDDRVTCPYHFSLHLHTAR